MMLRSVLRITCSARSNFRSPVCKTFDQSIKLLAHDYLFLKKNYLAGRRIELRHGEFR